MRPTTTRLLPCSPLLAALLLIGSPSVAAQDRASESAPGPLAGLESLVGTWISSLDGQDRDHPAVRRFNPELKSQEMTIRWGVDQETLHLQIHDLDRPREGDRTLIVEGTALWNPGEGQIVFVEYNSGQDLFLEGTYAPQEDGEIHRRYLAHFEGHEPRQFREVWRFDDASRSSFRWITEQDEGDGWRSSGVEVEWRKQAPPAVRMTRGSEHARLDFLLGTWEHREVQDFGGGEIEISSRRTAYWLPGDVWLRADATILGIPGIETHYGWEQMTWDPVEREYVHLWTDNQTALLFVSRGDWIDDSTLVLEGAHAWQGQRVETRTIFRLVSDDEYHREYRAVYESGAVRTSLAQQHRVPLTP